MRLPAVAALLLIAPSWAAAAEGPAPRLCEPWDSEYTGEDARGEHVLALWQFTAGSETADSSGRGHELTLDGAAIIPDGRFGGGLESSCGWPVADERHRARVKDSGALSPSGPFTLEIWICPNEKLDNDYPSAFLLDKKYVSDNDYQWILGAADRYGSRVMQASLGFGADSANYYSRPLKLVPGTWYHVAFTYDGRGKGSFYLNGNPWGGGQIDGRKSISPGTHILSIGDRVGSLYHGFPGVIDEVRICQGALEFRRASFEQAPGRTCFLRNEPQATIKLRLTNLLREAIARATVSVSQEASGGVEGSGLGAQGSALVTQAARSKETIPSSRRENRDSPGVVSQGISGLASGQAMVIEYPLDLSLRPGAYRVTARLEVKEPREYVSEDALTIRIAPRRPPQFPVVMWGLGSPAAVLSEMERLEAIGFTHVLGMRADYQKIWQAGSPAEAADPEVVEETRRMLDEALARGLSIAAGLSPGAAMRGNESLRRVDRGGRPYAREDVCGLLPELGRFCFNVGASVARSYGDHPAWKAALLHTEVRGHAGPCFHEEDRRAFWEHAGIDVPAEVAGSRGVDYTKLAGFPASRVIPDDHPLLVYYRWYWKEGDGWNGLSTRLHEGLKSTGRDDVWTWHDPAVRAASVYGAGGGVDILSQWTYSYPDPIRIALATEELLAMAAGAGRPQQVMKMTQIIWYRSQTAPEPTLPENGLPYRARWEEEQPDAPFITIAPLHLREAFWTKIARPIRGIMYHGWQSLVPCEPPRGYRYTHPQTRHELARLVREVVRPLGPALLEVPGVKSDVAMLESFAAEMFARRGTFGWNGTWAGDVYHALLYAHLQPEIVFDETITERGLDGFRVLVMPDCDVLTQSVADRVRAFQAAGGLVVGDDRLAPAITPDVRLAAFERTGRADEDKAALVRLAAELRRKLDPHYRRYVDTSNPDVIPYRRRAGGTDYVFLVNDHREYGQYVGHHGLVMENGLPSEAVVWIDRPDGFVYDLVSRRRLETETTGGRLALHVHLGPCDGKLLMITPRAIEGIRIHAPEEIARGQTVHATIDVIDSDGRSVDAVVPLEVNIRDSQGGLAEFSGYYGAAGGTVKLALDIARNDPFGVWQVEVRELASGISASHYLRVLGPKPWPPSGGSAWPTAAEGVQPQG